VLLPGLAALFGGAKTAPNLLEVARSVGTVLGMFVLFIAVMLIVGKKVIPAILHYVAHTGSRELFRLAVLSIALGVAYAAAELFGISLALGAFFAGMMLSESQLSQQAATESLPLRDAFAVLFFVSVGMLFGPAIVVEAPVALIATVLIIMVGKSAAAYAVVRLFGHSRPAALMVTASLAQIGEFSFILANRSLQLGLLPVEGRDLILGGAIISILLNPLLFAVLDLYAARREKVLAEQAAADQPATEEAAPMREPIRPTSLTDHVVLIGHGRVGSYVSGRLKARNVKLFVIEDDEEGVAALKQEGIEALEGNAADPGVIQAANLPEARCLLVAIPDAFEGGQVVHQAHAINPNLPIIARAHSEEEIDYLRRHGASVVVMGEHEIAKAMLDSVAEIQTMVEQAIEARPERAAEADMEEKPAVS
jgi:CPA2 family monovalent cation:H+ antiporter-2